MAADALSNPQTSTTESVHGEDSAHFAGHVFDVARDQLSRGQAVLPLAPKALTLLKYFLHHPERVLKKEDLTTAVWGSTVVTENSLAQLVLELRNALGDREQRIVKTVPRRGYLLAVPVEWRGAQASPLPGARPSQRRKLLAGVATLICLTLVLMVRAPQKTYSVDAEVRNAFPVFVAPLVEDDINGEPSQLGRRIAGDVSAHLVHGRLRLAPSEDGAKLVVRGRLVRRTPAGIVVDMQMKESSTGTTYPLIQVSFENEDDMVRSDLAERVARAMANRRDEIILARARQPAHQPDAVELLLMAWSDFYLAKTEADLARASTRFEAVLQKDPTSVYARAGLSVVCLNNFTRLFSASPRTTLTACEQQIRELYAKAPEHSDAMAMQAYVLHAQGRSDEALWLLRKALDLLPRDRAANFYMAMVLVKEGRFDEAAPYLEFSRTLSERRREHGPSDRRRQAYFYQLFADTAFLQGRDDESYGWLARWAAEMPDDGRPLLMLAAIDSLHGREEQAKSNMARHRELLPRTTLRYVEMLYPTSSPAVLAQRVRLLEGMKKAGLPEGAPSGDPPQSQHVATIRR
jgi:DNA-binding winged helix-turn-helix (wHTH) protein/tetratricopeptide (TPR) repeat protein